MDAFISFKYLSTYSVAILKLFIVAQLLLLVKVGISEVFSLVKTLVKNSFSIVAFLVPSDTITPPSSTRFPTDSLVLHFDWT